MITMNLFYSHILGLEEVGFPHQPAAGSSSATLIMWRVLPRSGCKVSLLRGATETIQSGLFTLSHVTIPTPDIPGPDLGPAAILPTVSPLALVTQQLPSFSNNMQNSALSFETTTLHSGCAVAHRIINVRSTYPGTTRQLVYLPG